MTFKKEYLITYACVNHILSTNGHLTAQLKCGYRVLIVKFLFFLMGYEWENYGIKVKHRLSVYLT